MTKPFRVLSLDGGGIRGVFPAAYLAVLEDALDSGPIAKHFDLIAGTSTGGIIALGLGFGISPADIEKMYREAGPRIFPNNWWRFKVIRFIRGPLYSPEPLRNELVKLFGDAKLGDVTTPVIVPAVDAARGGIHVFKSLNDSRLLTDRRVSIVDVALATSAAPFYFPAHETDRGRWIDGGVWANSPVAVAAAEAIGFMGVPKDKVRILSVGTTSSPFHLGDSSLRGFWKASRHIDVFSVAMAPQMLGSIGLAQTMLGGRHRVMRIEREVAKGRFALDRTADIGELARLGYAEARQSATRVREFLQLSSPDTRSG